MEKEQEFEGGGGGEIKRRTVRRPFFAGQPLRLDLYSSSFLRHSNVPLSNSKAPLNEVNCSESNWNLRYVLAPFVEAHVEIT